MANSADPDQLIPLEANCLDLHCLQRQGISGLSRTRVNSRLTNYIVSFEQLGPDILFLHKNRSFVLIKTASLKYF